MGWIFWWFPFARPQSVGLVRRGGDCLHYLRHYGAYNHWNYEPGDIHCKADEGSGQQSEEKIVGMGWNVSILLLVDYARL